MVYAMTWNLKKTVLGISLVIAACSQNHDTHIDNVNAMRGGCGLEAASSEFKFNSALALCAESGQSEAQAWLGMMYWWDSTEPEQPLLTDYYPNLSTLEMQRQGANLLKMAANSGNVLAANELGLAHFEGSYGQNTDYRTALKWLKIADQAGDEFAPQNLAIMYLRGTGVEKSKSKAIEHLERAANRGSVIALWTMGAWHAAHPAPGSKEKSEKYFAEAERLGGECQRPSEICEDFLPLFEDETALIAANEYVSQASLTAC